jgi:hypothetical protein
MFVWINGAPIEDSTEQFADKSLHSILIPSILWVNLFIHNPWADSFTITAEVVRSISSCSCSREKMLKICH